MTKESEWDYRYCRECGECSSGSLYCITCEESKCEESK